MRATRQDVTGKIGETEVSGKFERLRWGVAPNPRHDLGTDLWLMARDARLFDLGLVVGAQVKSGPSWFRKESRDSAGALLGWWFRDSNRKHIDAWLAHGLPHLIVLHDLEKQISYWAHVTEDAVVGTGKGAKILVPVGSTVDDAHLDDLLHVAASKRTGGSWEGSAWSGASAVPPSALLRHALIVPRLVAPHPNAGHDKALAPAQALALLVQARLPDLHQNSQQHAGVPSLEDARDSPNWDWRFVGAMGNRLTAGKHQALADAVQDAPDAARRAAAAVATAATMLEDGLADEALAVLDAALKHDDAEPVDQAWLTVQQARACADIGRVDQARDLAASAQAVGATHHGDVTATALAGVAALLLFNTSGWGQADVASVIAGADTAAAWWRTQTVSQGLTALTERTFWAWSRDTTVRLFASDTANDQLLSAALTASYVGDHATWRHLSGLLGQDGLLRLNRDASPEKAQSALRTLRLAGNADNIKHAVRRLANDGPATAVTLAAAEISLDRATRTTAAADLALLEEGGDLLDEQTAVTTVQWLLEALDDPTAFRDRTSPSFLLGPRLVDTLAQVAPAAPPPAQRLVVEHVSSLPPQADQMFATSWAKVVQALPMDAWTDLLGLRVGASATGHHQALSTPLLRIASRYDETVRQRLIDDAATGSLDALVALGDVTRLPEDLVRTLVATLSERVRDQVEAAAKGTFGMGAHDYGHTLTLLNVWHPALACWRPLLALIEDRRTAGEHKRGAMRLLAGMADRVPNDVRAPLLAAARSAAAQTPPDFLGLLGERKDATGPATELVAALAAVATEDGVTEPEQIPTLLAGGDEARASAARIALRLRRPEDIGVLLVLANDYDPGVRTTAAFGLAQIVADGEGGPGALAAVWRAAADPGRCVPHAVAAGLSQGTGLAPETRDVLGHLRRHPSAQVRRVATGPAED